MKSLYDLYNFFTFHNEEKNEKKEYNKIINKIFIKEFLQYNFLNFGEDPIGFLSDRYFKILEKLENIIRGENNHCKRKRIITKWGETSKSYRLENGELLYSFKYKDKKIIHGKLNFYKNDEFTNLFNCSFDENENKKSGYIHQYSKNSQRLEYTDFILNNLFHGKGYLSLSLRSIFDGEFKEGKKAFGKQISYSYIFDGEFENDKPYSGKMEVKRKNYKYDGIYGFNGEIVKGKVFSGKGYLETKRFSADPCLYEPDYPDEFIKEQEKDQISEYLESKYNDLMENKHSVIEIIKCTINNNKIIECEDNLYNKDYI